MNMKKNNLNQKSKNFKDFFYKNKFNFSSYPINRLKKISIVNDKTKLLENLKLKILKINNCELKKISKNIVFGDGDINSPLMLIGEAPGQTEDEKGKPFVGEAGLLLNNMLKAININRNDVYVTNVVNYRPPLNRKPEISEINKYSIYLREHISIIDPKILIFLGSTAMNSMFGINNKISEVRGTWKELIIKNKTFLSMISFHPAYLLRKTDQKKFSWQDLKEVRRKIDELKINI